MGEIAYGLNLQVAKELWRTLPPVVVPVDVGDGQARKLFVGHVSQGTASFEESICPHAKRQRDGHAERGDDGDDCWGLADSTLPSRELLVNTAICRLEHDFPHPSEPPCALSGDRNVRDTGPDTEDMQIRWSPV